MNKLLTRLKELRRYPSLMVGLTLMAIMVAIAIYAPIAMPYDEAIRLWRGGPGVWDDNPRNARPVVEDWLTADRLPRTIIVASEDGIRRVEPLREGRQLVETLLPFHYDYDRFPTELILSTWVTGGDAETRISVFWETPARETITLREDHHTLGLYVYRICQDAVLRERLRRVSFEGLFVARGNGDRPGDRPLKGDYQLVLRAELPEGAEIRARLVVYGQVEGLFGTDNRRRDLGVALLWGTPIALIFGVLAAAGMLLSNFVLSAIGTWFGGKVDYLFERLVEINIIIPTLPILIAVAHFHTRSLWVMLGVIIVASLFGGGMKVYRAMFLQAKEAHYIEAAQAYGAGHWRIIRRYLMPRLAPVLLPAFITAVPAFVFMEATLAMLGLGDPVLPTWGKIIYDAQRAEALLHRQYYWVLLPSFLLMMTGFGFAMVGYTLDRIFNPKLRTM